MKTIENSPIEDNPYKNGKDNLCGHPFDQACLWFDRLKTTQEHMCGLPFDLATVWSDRLPITVHHRYGTGSLIFWSDWVDTCLGSGRKTVFSCLQLHYRKTQVLHAIMCRFLVSIYFDIGWLTDNYKNLLFKVRTSNMHPHARADVWVFPLFFLATA